MAAPTVTTTPASAIGATQATVGGNATQTTNPIATTGVVYGTQSPVIVQTNNSPIQPGPSIALNNGSNYDSFPGACKCHNGDFLVVYRGNVNAHPIRDNGTGYKQRSTNQGTTWTAASVVVAAESGRDHRDFCLTRLSGANEIMMLYTSATFPSHTTSTEVRVALSTDDGASFATQGTIPYTADEYGIGATPVIELSNGDLMCGIYTKDSANTYQDTEIWKSTNKGVTWTLASTIAGDAVGASQQEPGLLLLPNGNLLLAIRYGDTTGMYWRESTDGEGGTTWGAATNFTTGEAAPRMILFKDKIYCTMRRLGDPFLLWMLIGDPSNLAAAWNTVGGIAKNNGYNNYAQCIDDGFNLYLVWSEDPTNSTNIGTDSDLYIRRLASHNYEAIADDSFDRSPSATLGATDASSGSGADRNWSIYYNGGTSSGAEISGNKLIYNNATVSSSVSCLVFTEASDFVMTVDVVPTAGFVALLFRLTGGAPTSSMSGYSVSLSTINDTATLYRWDSGTPTAIDGPAAVTVNANTTYSVKVTCNGSSISVAIDGTEYLTATDATYAGEAHGVQLDNIDGNTCSADNFLVMPIQSIGDTDFPIGTASGDFSDVLTGLTEDQLYYYNAYAIDDDDLIGEGSKESFTPTAAGGGTIPIFAHHYLQLARK